MKSYVWGNGHQEFTNIKKKEKENKYRERDRKRTRGKKNNLKRKKNSPTEPVRQGPCKEQQGSDPEERDGKSRKLERWEPAWVPYPVAASVPIENYSTKLLLLSGL